MTWPVQSPRPRPSLLRHQGPLVATLPAAGRISKILGKKASKWQPVYSVFILSSALGVQVVFFWHYSTQTEAVFAFQTFFLCASPSGNPFWEFAVHPHNVSQATGKKTKHLAILRDIWAPFGGFVPVLFVMSKNVVAGSPWQRLLNPETCPIRCGSPWVLPAQMCPNMHFLYRFHIVLYIQSGLHT